MECILDPFFTEIYFSGELHKFWLASVVKETHLTDLINTLRIRTNFSNENHLRWRHTNLNLNKVRKHWSLFYHVLPFLQILFWMRFFMCKCDAVCENEILEGNTQNDVLVSDFPLRIKE